MKIFQPVFALAIAVWLNSPIARAAITIVDTLVLTSETDGLSYNNIDASALSITGASKLVVTIGAEGADAAGTTPGSISSLTYGGVALTLIDSGGGGRSSVWYLDFGGASPVGTNFDLTFAGDNGATNTNVRGYYLSAYTLSGTANGVSSFGQSPYDADGAGGNPADHTLTEISPTTANEFLIAGYSRNSSNTDATPVTAGLSLLGSNVSLEGQYTNASIYGTLSSAGTQIIDIDGMNSSGRTVIATFAAIPEPGSCALACLSLLVICLRRRRA